jgi:hypothetical protein
MKAIFTAGLGVGVLLGVASAQPPVHEDPQPIYRVTVVSRNLGAVNYEHRGGPRRLISKEQFCFPTPRALLLSRAIGARYRSTRNSSAWMHPHVLDANT